MLFKQGRSIKSVLATSNTGLSLIPALINLVGLTLGDFLDFYFTMYTDANNSVDIEHGRSKNVQIMGNFSENVFYATSLYHTMACCALLHPGKLALAYGMMVEQLMSYSNTAGVFDPTHASLFRGKTSVKTRAFYPELTVSKHTTKPKVCGSVKMSERGIVIKIDLETTSGDNVASTYMGISEHIAAAHHGQSSSGTNQHKVSQHHARCLDVLDGTEQEDRTVTIRPSSFLGRFTNTDGSKMFPDPTAAGANPAVILRSAMLRLTLHTKHARCPVPSASQIFPTTRLRYQLPVTQLTLSHLRRNAIRVLRSWLPPHISHDILESIVILRYPHIDMTKLRLKANIHERNLSNL